MVLKKRTRIILGTLASLLIVIALGFFFVLPGYVEGSMNVVLKGPPYPASERADNRFVIIKTAAAWRKAHDRGSSACITSND